MPKYLLFILLSALPCSGLHAQEESHLTTFQALVGPSFSFGGFNLEVGIEAERKQHRVGLAYRSILSESRFFGRAEHGISLRYAHRFIQQNNWSAAFIGRVMQGFGEGGNRQGEYLLGQEATYAVSKRFSLDLVLAAGMYEETVKDNRYGVEIWDFGASGLVGLGLRYRLSSLGE